METSQQSASVLAKKKNSHRGVLLPATSMKKLNGLSPRRKLFSEKISYRAIPISGAPNLRFKAELLFAPPTGTSCWAGPIGVSSLVFLLFLFLFFLFYFCFPFLKIEQFNISKFVHSPIFIKLRI
jgi:hypothetical protein